MEQTKTVTAGFFTAANTVRSMYDKVDALEGNAGKVAILSASFVNETFTEEYKKADYQLFRLSHGFGTFPDKMGNACYGHFCADGEQCRMEKYNFVGIADEATAKYAEELEAKWQKGKKAVG